MKRWDIVEGAKGMVEIFAPVIALLALTGLWTMAMMRVADNYGIDPWLTCIAPLPVVVLVAMFVAMCRV